METSRIVLVTGANRGIGLEVCRQLALLGYKVILTSRNAEKGQKAFQQIQSSGDLVYHQLDVNDGQSIASMLNWVKETYGRLDVLINNAGINYDTWHTALKADLEESNQTIEANLFGPWRMCQAFIPMMMQNGYGRVVNVSSGAGAMNEMSGGTPAYSMSKAALNVLTIKLAANTSSDNILVNAVCPGWVRTDMGGANAPRSVEEGAKGIVWAATLQNNGPSGGFFRDEKSIAW